MERKTFKAKCSICGWDSHEFSDARFYEGYDDQAGCRVTTNRMRSDCEGFDIIYGHHNRSRDSEESRRGHVKMALVSDDGSTTPLLVGDYRVAVELSWNEIQQQVKEVARKRGFRI